MDFFHLIGETMCHQQADRCLSVDGQPLFVCGRCTGIYFGVLSGMIHLVVRRQIFNPKLTSRPAALFLLTLIGLMPLHVFFGIIFGFDGGNLARLANGYLFGVSYVFLIQPLIISRIEPPPAETNRFNRFDGVLALCFFSLTMIFLTGLTDIVPREVYEIGLLPGILLFYAVLNLLLIFYLVIPREYPLSVKKMPYFYFLGILLAVIEIAGATFIRHYLPILSKFS